MRDRDASSKSDRIADDSSASMGVATTNVMDRVIASIGLGQEGGIKPQFLRCSMYRAEAYCWHCRHYCSCLSGAQMIIFHFLRLTTGLQAFYAFGFMALARIKSIEKLRYQPPGEWGKLLGLDRVPEVSTLRDKVKILAESGNPLRWSAELCKDWMDGSPMDALIYYVDGHVRVYHGRQTKLPITSYHASVSACALRSIIGLTLWMASLFLWFTRPWIRGLCRLLRMIFFLC